MRWYLTVLYHYGKRSFTEYYEVTKYNYDTASDFWDDGRVFFMMPSAWEPANAETKVFHIREST